MISSRSGSQGSASAPPPTIEAVRRRARHRLIGASILVAAGVIGFPLLFDSQPRPIAVDIPIEIPGRDGAPPLAGASRPAPAPSPSPTPTHSPAPSPAAAPTPAPAPSPTPAPAPSPAPAPAAPAPAPAPTPEPAKRDSAAEAARAQAILRGQQPPAAASTANERVVVQVGAFADEARAREARQKLERAGLKTYVNVAQTSDGKRTRVRVGPFDSRAEAEKAAARVKALGLPAAILTL
ncbi:SPOR domain-containing protein [Hydrogenophaga intermedia]|uniref:SPOR domain-containing protein n=1 Tax=Hydrogenophaga intermedia TaxID=65786 RepID=UPI0002607F17|nr:SPOR domain-containing protein [Hydrogenophaga intermedia]TMU76371.1 SPOR domain-containing protein [Hydrogenophaga intermedia]